MNENGIYGAEDYTLLLSEQPLPFPDKESTLVLFSQIVEHLPRAVAIHSLSEARRCLVRGGDAK